MMGIGSMNLIFVPIQIYTLKEFLIENHEIVSHYLINEEKITRTSDNSKCLKNSFMK